MRETLDQIRAAIPFGALLRIGDEAAFVEIEQIPEHHQPALVEREFQAVARRRVMDRRECVQIRANCQHVLIGDLGVLRVWEGWIEPSAALADAFMHRPQKIGVAPLADAGIRVGRDVRCHDRAERRVDRQAARERACFVSRVAGDAIARARKVFTAFHEIAAGRRRRCGCRIVRLRSVVRAGLRDRQLVVMSCGRPMHFVPCDIQRKQRKDCRQRRHPEVPTTRTLGKRIGRLHARGVLRHCGSPFRAQISRLSLSASFSDKAAIVSVQFTEAAVGITPLLAMNRFE